MADEEILQSPELKKKKNAVRFKISEQERKGAKTTGKKKKKLVYNKDYIL